MNRAGRIRSEKLREHQYIEGLLGVLRVRVELDEGRNVEQM